jgi:hypothetical protein
MLGAASLGLLLVAMSWVFGKDSQNRLHPLFESPYEFSREGQERRHRRAMEELKAMRVAIEPVEVRVWRPGMPKPKKEAKPV